MARPHPGRRHELGQNHLVDQGAIASVVGAVRRTRGPIVEVGPGGGALTAPLARLGRPLTAVELDPGRARALARRLRGVQVVEADFLRWRPPRTPHVLVGNVPFSITTALLRRVLGQEGWTDAVLLVQWEVARRRAGVGGASLLTVEHWPWIEATLVRRVPARAFRPVPAVDGGIVALRRRSDPLLPMAERERYRRLVGAVFRAPAPDATAAARRAGLERGAVRRWARTAGVPPGARVRDLTAAQWVALLAEAR